MENWQNLVSVKILFFAKSRELAGLSECDIDLPKEISYSKLVKFLNQTYNLQLLKNTFLIAINSDYIADREALLILNPGDEIAVIPPISGG